VADPIRRGESTVRQSPDAVVATGSGRHPCALNDGREPVS